MITGRFIPARPAGRLAGELAGGTLPAIIPAARHGARSENTRYIELVLIDPGPDEDRPAYLVVTNLKSGHSDAYELPRGVRLTAQDEEIAAVACRCCVSNECECGGTDLTPEGGPL